MAKLVIVESPAKAKTIGKYLGDDYEVTASMGHIRDLPASQLGIDVEHGYAPQYISIKGKEKLIKELKSKAKHADGVLLATDPDREGEAISWHLANILGLDPHEPNRVTFDEITKKGVKEGMAHPRAIDEDLFNAQQARRVLDRLVGYKLSPFLWRKVRRGLSAGRVQSVAVRLIDDREKEIESFKPDEYWNVDATLGAGHKSFTARLATDASGKKLLLLCILKGSVVFMGDLMKKIQRPVEIDFMKVSSYGSGTSSSGRINILLDLHRGDLSDIDIVVVEDIVDSGRTLSYLENYLRLKGANSVSCCTMLDKPSRRQVDYTPKYVGAEIPDVFAVGYGLDYDERYRTLPFVGVLKAEGYQN